MAPASAVPSDASNKASRARDRRALARLAGWGGTAALALAALVATAQSDSGMRRLQSALDEPEQPAATLAPRAQDSAETGRLAAEVRQLAADRDRLAARLASLERSFDDMTGSIRKVAAAQDAVAQAPVSAPVVVSTAPAVPAVSPPVTAAAVPHPTPPIIDPLAMPGAAATAASWPEDTAAAPAPSPKADVPLPPTRLAAIAPREQAPPARRELGVDLGGAANIDVLRARWAAVKANFGPMLGGLRPVAVRDTRPGRSDVRLVVGPLPNAATATQLCTQLSAARINCRLARFEGENLGPH